MSLVLLILRILVPAAYLGLAAGHIISFVKKEPPRFAWGPPVLLLGLLGHALLLGLVRLQSNPYPLETPFQGLAFCGLVFMVLAAILVHQQKEAGYGAFLFPAGSMITGLALVFFNIGIPLPRFMGMQPLVAHTWVLFAAYACFLLSAITSVMYLIQHRKIRSRVLGPMYERLPALETMDQVVTRADAAGATLLLIGIALGFLWLNGMLARPANVNIKIALSMLAGLAYTCEHILRVGKGWKGQRACIVSLIGFGLVVVTLLAGRHGF